MRVDRILLPGAAAPASSRAGRWGWTIAAWTAWLLLLTRSGRVFTALWLGDFGERLAAIALLLLPPAFMAGGYLRDRGARVAALHSRPWPSAAGPVGGRRFHWTVESRWGIAGLGLLACVALTAPVVAPYPPDLKSEDIPGARYRPPLTRLHLLKLPDGDVIATPAVRETPGSLEYRRDGEWRRIDAPAGGIRLHTRRHWLGTDRFGRDLLSRILNGARVSLGIGLLAVLLAVTLGTLIGSIAGLAGGWVDTVLMRFVDIGLSLPRLFVILAVVGIFRPSLVLIVVLLGMTGWMDTARLVRGQILSLREREFVQAARAVGQRFPAILARHLLPNTAAPLLVDAALSVGNTILIEAALSYLGLGVQPPTPSWGNLVSAGRNVLLDAWWISTFPGLAIVLTVLSLNLLGDGLRRGWGPADARPRF
jgi:peptide/nickel transport system permease protein